MAIAVMAVLAALLLGALNRGRRASYSTICKSNLHQMGIALGLYTSDFHAYPIFHGDNVFWASYLDIYSGAKWDFDSFRGRAKANGKLYLCPGYAHLPFLYDPTPAQNPDPGWDLGTYSYNWRGVFGRIHTDDHWFLGLGGIGNGSAPDTALRDCRVSTPPLMRAIGDAPLWAAPDGGVWGSAEFPKNTFQGGWADYEFESGQVVGLPEQGYLPALRARVVSSLANRHGGRWNVLYCDGHVGAYRTKGLFDWTDDNVLSQWNNDNLPHREFLPDPP